MATICQTHSGEPNQCHLRSIGHRASVSSVPEIIHFCKTVTLLGRNKDVVDYSISCPVSGGKDCMSRIHARVIRTTNTYRLVDSSLTGVYVNDVRVNGTVNLQEGDTVTFGHPMGKDIRPGTQVRQPNSEFYFLFEHCYCRIDRLQSAHEEKRSLVPQTDLPLLTSPEGPQVYNSSLVFEKNVGLPIIPQLAWPSQMVPTSTALSKSSKHCGDIQSPKHTETLPLSSAGSVLSSAKSSLCTISVNVTSDKLEMPAACRSTATPCTSLEDCSRPSSQIIRSASPEYVHRNGSVVSAVSSQQSTFETAQFSLFQENSRTAELANSDFCCVAPSGVQACTSEGTPKFYRPFLDEKHNSGETKTQPPVVTCHSQETSVPFHHSRDAVETHDSDLNGRAIFRAHLTDNSLDISTPFQVECAGNLDSKLLGPVADKSVPGNYANSDNDEEVMEISVINSPEETAKCETPGSSEPSIQIQVTEVINEAMKNVDVPSVSDYKESLIEKERSTEEQNEHSLEQHDVDVCVHETPCVGVSVTEAETFSCSKKRDCLHVNSLSESVIVEVENCSENSDSVTINSIPEDIASGKSPDSSSHETAKEEQGVLFQTMTVNRNLELSTPFGPGLELSHNLWHSEIKNEICKGELASFIEQNRLMTNEKAVKESDIVESESSVVDRDLETLNNTSAVETQEPAAALDVQEADEPRNDKIRMISEREVGAIQRDHVFQHKFQNALGQNCVSSDTRMINLEYQNSSYTHKIMTERATKMSGSEFDIGSAKSQENEDDRVNVAALFQSCTEQVISRSSGTEVIQCWDVLPSEEGDSFVDSHAGIDGLVSKIPQNNAGPSASENLPLCTQYLSDYHILSSSKDCIVSKDTYLEDVTLDCVCSSGSLHSESSPQQPALKAEETSNSDVVFKPLSEACCSLQARTVEMTSPECPCRYGDSGALTSAKRSVSETMNQETNIQPLTPNETEASFKQDLCNKANISHAVCLSVPVCTESEGFQSDHVSVTSSVSTKGVLQGVSSDFDINNIHLEMNASGGHDEQPDRNVNAASSTKNSPVIHQENDERESKMDSMATETRISSVINYIEVSGVEVGIQTRLINEREIKVLAKKPEVNGNENSVSNTSICEGKVVSMSVDANSSLQQISEAYERTTQDDNAGKNFGGEFSKQMKLDFIPEKKLCSETLSETFEEKAEFVALYSSPNKVTFLENTRERLVEVMNPEPPKDVCEELISQFLLQKSDCSLERERAPWKEEDQSYVSGAERKLEENTKGIKAEVFVNHTLDSTLDKHEMSDTDSQKINACSVVDDTASGGKQLNQSASIENTFCKNIDEDRVESKETMKTPSERCDSGSANNESIFEQQKNKGVDKETEIMSVVSVGQADFTHSGITETCTNSMEGNTVYPSSEEGGRVNDLSSLCLSKHSSLIAERSSDFNNYACSQIQSPYYVNKRDVENNSEPVNDSALPQQDTREEEDSKLNDENRIAAVNHKWSIKSVMLEKDKVEFKHADARFSDLDLETLNNSLENNRNSSVSSSCLELRQSSSALDNQQETDSHAVEPEHLGSNRESKSKESPVKQSLYSKDVAIDSGLKKLCDQNRTTEILSPIGLEKGSQSSISQEEGNIKQPTSEMDSQPCSVDRNAVAFGTPESAKENMPKNLLKEIETDSAEGSASFCAEELNLYVSHSAVQKEKEENNSMRMKNVTEMQYDSSKILKERDTVISDPNSVSGSIILQSDLDSKLGHHQLDKMIETPGVKSVIGTEKLTDGCLEEKNYSLCDAEYDVNEIMMSGPENYSMGVVAGEFSHLAKTPTPREEKEGNQTTAECDLVLLHCSQNSVEYPCIPGSQREMESVKDYEKFGLDKRDACSSGELVGNADSNSIQAGKNLENPEPENRLLDGCIQELNMGTLAVLRAPRGVSNDSPVTKTLTSLCAEKDEFYKERETNEQVHVQQESEESEPLKSQIELYQPTGYAEASADSDGNLNIPESNFVNRIGSHKEGSKDAQIKEANKNNYFKTLKRHVSRHEYSGISVSEDEQCSQKRKCSLGSLSMQEAVSEPPCPGVTLFSTPTDLKECHDRLISSGVKQFFQKYTILQTAQQLGEVEQENSKNIAQLVREFFKKTGDSDNLVNENKKPEMFVPPLENKVEEDADCEFVDEVNSGGSTASVGTSLSLLSSTEPQVNEKQSVKLTSEPQCLPLGSQLGFTEPAAGSADPCTDVLEEDLVSKIPESPSTDSLSEEEHFQSRVCSALNNRSVSVRSPLKSPHVESEESSKVKDLDFLFSDISNSSVESERYPLTQKLSSGSCGGTGDGLHEGISDDSGKAAAIDSESGFSCSSSEDLVVYWSDEDTNITSDLTATMSKSNQYVTAGVSPQHLEKGGHVESIVDKNCVSVVNQAERTLNGDKTPIPEDMCVPSSCANSVMGASPTSQKIILKGESYADQNVVHQNSGQNMQLSEISCLQKKTVCSPCKDLTPGATVDWNTNSPIQEQIASCERQGINSQMQLKRKLSHEEHDNSGNRSNISPPSKMCPLVTAMPSESADEEPAPRQKGIGTPNPSGSCSASQPSLADQVTQTPSEPEATCSLSLKKLKSSHSPVLSSAVHVNCASWKAVSSNVSRCLQSSYFNRELDLFSSECLPPETGDSAKLINSHHERTGKEDVDEDGQQKQTRQTHFYDHMDGRVTSEPCVPVGSGDHCDLQTTNDSSILKLRSSVPALGDVDLSSSALNSVTCEPAAFPSFKEESLQCSLEVQVHADTSEDLSLDFKAYPSAHSPVLSASNSCSASEPSVSSLTDSSFQPTNIVKMTNAQIQVRVPSFCASEAWKYSHPPSEHVYSSNEEPSCHSKDFGEDEQEFPSTSTESSNAIGLLSETKNLGDPSDAENSASTASSRDTIARESEVQKVWAVSERDIEFQLSQCQTVLNEISQTLCAVEGIDEAHMKEWREQIDKLQKDTKMPKTYIAVVGDTGAGKSSLLNALLDEEAVLPTSAMRACTAVVVEISKTSGESLYEADVEFLSKEEWDNELKALLGDMKDKSGNLKKRCPDRKTEAGAAYSRVKAVYGMIAELPKLKEMDEVTQHLGTVKHISAEKAADFRAKIEKFIDSRTDNLRDMKGGEFWPIVKCVKIRVPGSDVLKTGAVLVDLPGIRDSNAARDNAAKEYLKNCNAVWVVANITRAVDDNTAKEMLSANLRRQLLMDGQYGSLAFVCTKTDSFNITEIISDLDLRDEIQPLEISLEELESQRVQMEMEKETLYAKLQQEQQKQGADAENLASFEKENDIRKSILDKEFRINNLQRVKDKNIRAISLVCVQSRNRFSKQRIWVDFNNGLQEMKRKAVFAESGEDEEDEETEDEVLTTSGTGDPGEVESQHGKLQVFTVSSTEYLKLHGKLLRDGQPQVFHNDEDTEIPALRKFAIHTALQHSVVATEKVIRNVARIISQVVNYLTNQRAEDNSHRAQVQGIVQTCLSSLSALLREAVEDSLHDIKYYFSVLILANLKKGARKAKELCEDKVNGYHYATYRAVCARQGIYSSVACGSVDFNEQLSEPISSAISMTWNDVFSCRLEESIKQFSKAILDKLRYFFKDLKKKLQEKGRNIEAVNDIQRHQMEAVQALLCNFLLDQMEYISKRQRGISRVLTPEIQKNMKPIYAACNQLTGPGCFQRMKDLMQEYIRSKKEAVFDRATDKLQDQLNLLQGYIGGSFESVVQELTKSLTMQFEPMLKPVQKNDGIIPDLVNICAKVSKICKISCVDYVLPNPSQPESCSVPASPAKELSLKRELPEDTDPPCFLGKCSVIRIGTVSLPHLNPIQISVQEVSITLTDHTTMTLPFRSVYLCECCFHLYYLILHIAPEFAKDIYSRLGIQASNPSLGKQEALIILDKPKDPSSFHSLLEFLSARHGGAPWFRELNLQQGREKLESLDVYCTVQDVKDDGEEKTEDVPPSSSSSDQPPIFTIALQPPLPGVSLYPYGRKRGGGEIHSQLEKKHKGKAIEQIPEGEPAGPCPPSPHIPGRLMVSARKPMAGHPWTTSREYAPECHECNAASLPGTFLSKAPRSCHVNVKNERDLITFPSAAGVHVRAKEGIWGKWPNPSAQEDNSSDVDKMETNGNKHTAEDLWNPH